MRTLVTLLLGVVVVVFALVLGANTWVLLSARDAIVSEVTDAPTADAILVLGASVYRSGAPSPILEDRLTTAIELYREGKSEKIIVSGDHGEDRNNEPKAMQRVLIGAGIPAENIFLDHAGFDTFDSVYRARDIFQARSLLIVSQSFHLPRAVFIGKKLGLEVTGVSSDLRNYGEQTDRYNRVRETLARVKAVLDIWLGAVPTYLGEPIPLSSDGRMTDDERTVQ